MPTSKLDLMELLAATVMAAQAGTAAKPHPQTDRAAELSYFDDPAADLNVASTTLSGLLGDRPDLLSALAASCESASAEVEARIVSQIAAFLADPAVDLDMPEYRTRRFLDFVYPVV